MSSKVYSFKTTTCIIIYSPFTFFTALNPSKYFVDGSVPVDCKYAEFKDPDISNSCILLPSSASCWMSNRYLTLKIQKQNSYPLPPWKCSVPSGNSPAINKFTQAKNPEVITCPFFLSHTYLINKEILEDLVSRHPKSYYYFLPPLHCPGPSHHYLLSQLFQNPLNWSPTNLNSAGGINFFMRQIHILWLTCAKLQSWEEQESNCLPWSTRSPFALIITLIPFALATLEHSYLSPPWDFQDFSLAILEF